jgi:hypothetical protein
MARERTDASQIPVQTEYRRVETVKATQMQSPFVIPANLTVHGREDYGEAGDWLIVDRNGRRSTMTNGFFQRNYTRT